MAIYPPAVHNKSSLEENISKEHDEKRSRPNLDPPPPTDISTEIKDQAARTPLCVLDQPVELDNGQIIVHESMNFDGGTVASPVKNTLTTLQKPIYHADAQRLVHEPMNV